MKINGSLVFDASSASEIQNLRIQKVTGTNPTHTEADRGRLIYNTTDNKVYVGGASAWVAIATGGDAAALAARVDNLVTTLGLTDSEGVFNASAVNTALANADGATNLFEVLQDLDAAITAAAGVDTLDELADVTLNTNVAGQVLRYTGTVWANHTPVLADITDVTATAAEVNLALDGITASAAELNILDGVIGTSAADISSIAGYAAQGVSATEFGYVNNVTSPIQTQLDSKQSGDATLTALAALNSDAGLVVQTGADTFTKRSLVQPSAGITIANADGQAGNPTFALANDLAALEGLATTGYVVRTGDGTMATRTIDGNAGRIVVSDAGGVATNTNIDLATLTDAGTGTFLKLTRDTYGRVSGTTAVVQSDITGLVDSVYVKISGDAMTGSLDMGGNSVTNLASPVGATDAATKGYVDAVASGLAAKPAVEVAAVGSAGLTSLGSFTYNNGTAGVGATLTATANGAFPTVDGYTLNSTTPGLNGVLIAFPNGTADAVYNGRYNLTQLGNGSTPWVLTRCGLCDESTEIEGAYVFVKQGTNYQGTGWVQVHNPSDPDSTITVGTDQIWVYQFSSAGTVQAGTGLSQSGTVINVNLGAGIFEGPADAVGIDLFTPTAGALILTTNGTTRESPISLLGQLHLLLASGGGLTQDSTGLYIPASGVTNAMLANNTITINADAGGTDNVALGETILFAGSSVQGISTNRSGDNTITIAGIDASATQKGVASFNATEFSVTAGAVSLGTLPVAKIATPTIGFVGTNASSDTVTLGESFTFVDGGSLAQAALVSVVIGTNSGTIALRQATTTAAGVASFSDQHFSVTAGAVSLNATIGDLTNVAAGADAASANDVLSFVGGEWTNVTRAAVVGSANLGDLADVGTATPTDGHLLVGNGTSWNNQKAYHLHDQTAPDTTWTVVHNLGQQFCVVTVIDSTNEVVIPQSIVFGGVSELTVTFNTAITGKVAVMGIA
jgi:hypothetical protein